MRGGDIGFATEEDLKNNNFPAGSDRKFFGPMQVGDYTQPVRFSSGKWYIFKLAEKRLTTENLTLESPGVRQQITQGLTNQRKQILNAALLETAINEAKIVNNLAANMLNNPGNLGLRPLRTARRLLRQPTQATRGSSPAGDNQFTRDGEAGGITDVSKRYTHFAQRRKDVFASAPLLVLRLCEIHDVVSAFRSL